MKSTRLLAFAAALAALPLAAAKADPVGPDWAPIEKVIEAAKAAGYAEISKVEADDGHWEGEGVKAGKRMNFNADPKTGKITDERQDW